MGAQRPDIGQQKDLARRFRKEILQVIHEAGSGHPGGSLSLVEILIALYFYKLRVDPGNPRWKERDILILSKGHCCPALYVALAERGFFPKDELKSFRKLGALLQGHAYAGVPGVELSTGSLGQGLAVANGWALASRMDESSRRVYCILGDGEMDEGSVWEAFMTSGFRKLDNVCAVVDRNMVQQDGQTFKIKDLESVSLKIRSCGWEVIDVDGHDANAVMDALDKAETIKGKPTCLIAKTVKGKGVSFMEYHPDWHGKAPNKEELERALKEL
jgi:transketolase